MHSTTSKQDIKGLFIPLNDSAITDPNQISEFIIYIWIYICQAL